jgi:prevent-host-death family protein
MEAVENSYAKAKLDVVLAEIAETGEPITMTERGRPVAMLVAVTPRRRRFGQLLDLVVPENFGDPLPGLEIFVQEGNSPT